ncbi:hypothetical protein [Streptomyces sp. G-5]|uniref:hypothetical protein n=1 Tax=Streptomyces sp. G-5 TaxID=2977231 RepID=UPI0021D37246|nr:hypothetical protein [Streptomyces sp. G-5]MCU4750299.1 hypothetical protein [Streptomyces sp. G-5]
MSSPGRIRLARLLVGLLAAITLAMVTAAPAVADPDPDGDYIADFGPSDGAFPKEWRDAGEPMGVTEDGKFWCVPDSAPNCRYATPGELPALPSPGEASGDEGDPTPERIAERQDFEEGRYEDWKAEQDQTSDLYRDREAFIDECLAPLLDDGDDVYVSFQNCLNLAMNSHPDPPDGPLAWVAGKISQLASDALQEFAGYIGEGVLWLLEQFADVFNEVSTINLGQTGIGQMLGIMTVLSVIIALGLLLVQWAKVGVTGDSKAAVTALTGLAKYAFLLAVYITVTVTALEWSDQVSTWIINVSFEGGGEGEEAAAQAMRANLGAMFAGLTGAGGGAAAAGAIMAGTAVLPAAVGFVIVIGIITIIAIGALWIEMLMRQAGIMILVVTMPIVLAGQMADGTRDWWPKARNALIALILLKPVIVLCFGIGFGAMAAGEGVRNVLVGLLMFVLAAFAWPVLARFITFTSDRDGQGTASGLLSTAGSTGSSFFGGGRGAPAGAGATPGGPGYTQALEQETAHNTANAARGNRAAAGGKGAAGGGFLGAVGGAVAVGMQLAAMGKDTLESSAANMGAHAGLGGGAFGGRHSLVTGAGRGAAGEADPGTPPSADTPPPATQQENPVPQTPAMQQPAQESVPPPQPSPSDSASTTRPASSRTNRPASVQPSRSPSAPPPAPPREGM